jgi:hypothetical protein
MKVIPPGVLVLVLLAGCGAPPGDGPAGDRPTDGHDASDAPGADGQAAAGDGLAPSPVGEVWALSDCSTARFNVPQEREAASQGLPPDHRPNGDVAFLTLMVLDCGALSRGNHSVAKPFAWALATTPLVPLEDDGALEAFVREVVTADAGAAAALASFGFPVVAGSVELGPSETGLGAAFVVEGEGLRYSADSPLAAPSDAGADRGLRLRGADGTRLFWLDCSVEVGATAVVDAPAVSVLEGGAMAQALGMDGPAPGTLALGQESWSCVLADHDSA